MREIKQQVLAAIDQGLAQGISTLLALPARKVINPLIGLLCSTDELKQWRAVSAIGLVAAALAETDQESARIIMRRLIWQLNDESGGIGWGVPQAMAEIMAQSETLAVEYASILVSYILTDRNYIDFPELQRGVLWGIGRLAECRPQLMQAAVSGIEPFLTSTDVVLRGLAARAASHIGAPQLKPLLEGLADDHDSLRIYLHGALVKRTVAELSRSAG